MSAGGKLPFPCHYMILLKIVFLYGLWLQVYLPLVLWVPWQTKMKGTKYNAPYLYNIKWSQAATESDCFCVGRHVCSQVARMYSLQLVIVTALNVMSSGGPKTKLGRDILYMVKTLTRSWQAKGSARTIDLPSQKCVMSALYNHACAEMATITQPQQ